MIHSIRQRQPAQDQMDISRMLNVFATEVTTTGQTIPMVMGWAAVTLKLVGSKLFIGIQADKAYQLPDLKLLKDSFSCKLKAVKPSSTRIKGDAGKLGQSVVLDVNHKDMQGYKLKVEAKRAG